MFGSSFGCRRFVSHEEGVPELVEDEVISFTLRSVHLQFNDDATDSGSLFITTKRFLFIGRASAYDIDIPYIVLHAISKDPESYPQPCLYLQLDTDEDASDQSTNEIHVVTEEEKDLFPLFEAMSYAASINPDALDDEDDDGLIFNEQEVQLGAAQAKHLMHWDDLLAKGIGGGKFDDAETK